MSFVELIPVALKPIIIIIEAGVERDILTALHRRKSELVGRHPSILGMHDWLSASDEVKTVGLTRTDALSGPS